MAENKINLSWKTFVLVIAAVLAALADCEWIGAVADARRHYRTLLEHPRDLSVAMKKLVAAKIKQQGQH